MNIYAGNLSYQITEDQLQALFAEFGAVQSAKLITDRETGRAKGFGFVEMENNDEAQQAIEALNGKEMEGRKMIVNESRGKPAGGNGGFRGNNNRRPSNNW